MIDVATEKLMTLEQASEKLLLPKTTLVKWIKYGTKGVKLEAIKFGTHWRTSVEAIQRFGDRQTPNQGKTDSPVVPSRTAFQAQRQRECAKQQLEEIFGIRRCETCKKELNTYKKTVPKKEKLWCPQCLVKLPGATIAQRLRTFRWEANISQDELSKKTGIKVSNLRAYELNKKAPTDEAVAKLVEVLGVEMVSGMVSGMSSPEEKAEGSQT
jgi:excisionase family DNA binding protein